VLGYRFDTTKQADLSVYDYWVNSVFASPWLRFGRATVRVDGLWFDMRRDGDAYLQLGTLRPNLYWDFGERFGVTRVFFEAEWHDYLDQDLVGFQKALDRDAVVLGAGLEHFRELPGLDGSLGRVGARYSNTDTDADGLAGDPFALDGDYDNDTAELWARVELPLFFDFELDVLGGVAFEEYENNSLIALATEGKFFHKRSDTVGSLALALSRPLHRRVELELSWRGIWRDSNVEAFDYDRQIYGVNLRVASE
jgi:hypothetical protein